MVWIAVPYPYGSFDPGHGLPIVPSAPGIWVSDEVEAQIRAEAARLPDKRFKIVRVDGSAPPPPATGAAVTDTFVLDLLAEHRNSPAPHPVYDDCPDLVVLLENRMI